MLTLQRAYPVSDQGTGLCYVKQLTSDTAPLKDVLVLHPRPLPPADQCPAITLTPHMVVSGGGTQEGDTATFGCSDGYRLVGASHLICLPGSIWSAPIPTCTLGRTSGYDLMPLIFSSGPCLTFNLPLACTPLQARPFTKQIIALSANPPIQ